MKVLGIDIGGSGIKGALVDIKTGQLISERRRIPTPTPATPEAVTKTIKQLVKYFNWSGEIGCGFPAVIRNGIVCTASNIVKSWIGTNVIELFTNSTKCQTNVINDADAAGLAEMEFGGGRNHQGVVLVITVGTGIGTAFFSGRKLMPNTEFGHIYVNGMIAEQYASDAIRKKEDLSWKKWAKRFNKYLSELERLLWPDLIIIGGGASKKYMKFSPYLSTNSELLSAQLLNEAGIIGAALSTRLL